MTRTAASRTAVVVVLVLIVCILLLMIEQSPDPSRWYPSDAEDIKLTVLPLVVSKGAGISPIVKLYFRNRSKAELRFVTRGHLFERFDLSVIDSKGVDHVRERFGLMYAKHISPDTIIAVAPGEVVGGEFGLIGAVDTDFRTMEGIYRLQAFLNDDSDHVIAKSNVVQIEIHP